jgi:type IV pilus assembly protein PilQ
MAVSCQSFSPRDTLDNRIADRDAEKNGILEQTRRERALDAEVKRRFGLVRQLIKAKKFSAADDILASLSLLDQYHDEIADLKRLIDLARNMGANMTALAIDQQRIINESADSLVLPKRYRNSVEYTPELEPEFLPDGPLEKLLTTHISLKVENLPLADLAMQLQSVDELNIADPLNIIFSDETVKGKTFSCNFKDVPLGEVFSFISRNLGVTFNINEHLIWVTTSPQGTKGYKLETKIVHLRHGVIPTVPEGIGVTGTTAFKSGQETDTDLQTALEKFFKDSPTGGSYSFFPNRNLLIITDTRENLRILERLIYELDKPPYQVVIEAKFITVSEDDLNDVGVEFSKVNGGQSGSSIEPDHQTNANISNFFSNLGAIQSNNAAGAGGITISGILGNRSYDMLISAIQNKTSTVTLSAPRVTVLNNRTARIRKGDKYLYFKEYTLQTVDNGDEGTDRILVPKGSPTELPIGITFDAKVSIGNDAQTILLGLKPEIITFLAWEDYSSTNEETKDKVTTTYDTSVRVPRTHEQGVATSVAIKSGETVILGGMVENSKIKTVKKLPILGDIPYLGVFFRHTTITETPTCLLIFVTATIINENGEYVRYVAPPTVTADDLTQLQPVSAPTGTLPEANN